MMASCREVWAALMLLLLFCFTPTRSQTATCRDTKSECLEWGVTGRCQLVPQTMTETCPATCGFCTNPGCQKTGINCPWRVVCKACHALGQRAQPYCTACNRTRDNNAFLPKLLKKPQTITSPNFECGRKVATSSSRSRGSSSSSSSSSRASSSSSSRGRSLSRRVRQILFPDQFEKLQKAFLERNKTETKLNEDETPMVSVTDTFCGATPISDHFLLTAAHCVFDSKNPLNAVRLGELDFRKDNEQNSAPADYEIEEIIVHSNFSHDTYVRYNDIALLKTVKKMEFNEFVFPYCLSRVRPKPETPVTGAGFGLINATHQSPILQEVELKVVGTTECEDRYKKVDREPHLRVVYPDLLQDKDIICASYPERSTCQGDSGGPLFLDDPQGRRFLVGIVGGGLSCRNNGIAALPGLYISVAEHIDFIDSVLYSGQ